MLKQLSVFARNQKGAMQKITGLLKKEEINILGSVTNDSPEYGIVRMVVDEPEKALEILSAEGYQCCLTDVLGAETEDEVGSLNRLLEALSESNISVDYLYLSFNRVSGKPVLVFHCEDAEEVEACLTSKGFRLTAHENIVRF